MLSLVHQHNIICFYAHILDLRHPCGTATTNTSHAARRVSCAPILRDVDLPNRGPRASTVSLPSGNGVVAELHSACLYLAKPRRIAARLILFPNGHPRENPQRETNSQHLVQSRHRKLRQIHALSPPPAALLLQKPDPRRVKSSRRSALTPFIPGAYGQVKAASRINRLQPS